MKIVFIGNCHAEVLYRVLGQVCPNEKALDRHYFGTHIPLTDADRAVIASSDMVVQQTADFTEIANSLDTGNARRIPFPLLMGQFLWPFNTKDHPCRGELRPECGDTRFFTFPVTDGQVIRLMKSRNVGPDSCETEIEDLLDEYMSLDYAELTDLDRQLTFSREKLRRAADIVGYDIWSAIERDFRSIPTFITALHPTDTVMVELIRQVLPRCGFPISHAQILIAVDKAYEGDSIYGYAAPIHPSVIRHFDLSVAGDPPTYRFWCDGAITARALAKRIVKLDASRPVHSVLFGRASDISIDERLGMLDAMTQDQIGNATFFLHYGNLLARLGREAEALRIYIAGLHDSPGHIGLSRRVTKELSRSLVSTGLVELSVASPINFGVDGVGRALLLGSWNRGIDTTGVWLDGYAGILRFRLSIALREANRVVELRFIARAFGGCDADLQVRIYANGREAGFWDFGREAAGDMRRVTLCPAVACASMIDLSFHVNRLVRPIDLGLSGDTRSFGIGISQLTVDSCSEH